MLFCGQEIPGSLYTLAHEHSEDWLASLLHSAGQHSNVAMQDPLSALSFTRFMSCQGHSALSQLRLLCKMLL